MWRGVDDVVLVGLHGGTVEVACAVIKFDFHIRIRPYTPTDPSEPLLFIVLLCIDWDYGVWILILAFLYLLALLNSVL